MILYWISIYFFLKNANSKFSRKCLYKIFKVILKNIMLKISKTLTNSV